MSTGRITERPNAGKRDVFPQRVCVVDRRTLQDDAAPMREARALVGAGVETHILCRRDAGGQKWRHVDGASVRYCGEGSLEGRGAAANAFFALRVSAALLVLHLGQRFRIVQINFSSAWLVLAVAAARSLGARVILHMMEPVAEKLADTRRKPHFKPALAAAAWASGLAWKLAFRVVVGTREMREHMGRHGADIHKIVVVLNVPEKRAERLAPSDLDAVADLKKDERRRGVFRIVMRDRQMDPGGISDVVRALVLVVKKVPGAELHVLGRGGADLRRLAAECEVEDRVHMIAPESDILREMLAADVAVVPWRASVYSSLVIDIGLFEFAALKKPIITARLPAVESYFSEEGLVLFEAGNPQGLADRIYHVFAHPEESRRRTEKMSEFLETYSWEREQKKYLGVFQTLSPDD